VDAHRHREVAGRERARDLLQVHADEVAGGGLPLVLDLQADRAAVLRQREVVARPLGRNAGRVLVAMVHLLLA
jgi:hypothetical protein